MDVCSNRLIIMPNIILTNKQYNLAAYINFFYKAEVNDMDLTDEDGWYQTLSLKLLFDRSIVNIED